MQFENDGNKTSNKIIQYLLENNIPFQVITHSSAGGVKEYSVTVGTRLEQQAKALFLRFRRKGEKAFAIAALPAQKKADFNLLCRLLDATEVRLGTAEQLEQITGCRYGELPPLGRLFSTPMLMDKDLLTEVAIFFNAGSLTRSIKLNPHDLVKVEQPILF